MDKKQKKGKLMLGPQRSWFVSKSPQRSFDNVWCAAPCPHLVQNSCSFYFCTDSIAFPLVDPRDIFYILVSPRDVLWSTLSLITGVWSFSWRNYFVATLIVICPFETLLLI